MEAILKWLALLALLAVIGTALVIVLGGVIGSMRNGIRIRELFTLGVVLILLPIGVREFVPALTEASVAAFEESIAQMERVVVAFEGLGQRMGDGSTVSTNDTTTTITVTGDATPIINDLVGTGSGGVVVSPPPTPDINVGGGGPTVSAPTPVPPTVPPTSTTAPIDLNNWNVMTPVPTP